MIRYIGRAQKWWQERKLARQLRSLHGGGGYVPAAPVLSGTFITPETALGLAAVFAAVNVISRDVASLPRNVYRKLPDGGRKVDEHHPIQELIYTSPDGELDSYRFYQSLMSHVLTRGNGYAEIERDKDGTPTAMHLLHPSKTLPKRTRRGRLYYELTENVPAGTRPPTLWAEDMLHLAGLGFNGLVGYSPVTVARQTIGLGMAVEQYGAAFFGNAAIPKGLLKTPQKLNEAAVNNLRKTVNQVHQGSQSAHQLMILEQGLEWVQTQFSPEDGQFLLTREFQVKEIARLYGLPPHKIGDYSQSHLANVEEANLDYASMTLYGWIIMLEAQHNSKLLTREERQKYEIRVDMAALMRGNTKDRTTYYQTLRNAGALTANEIRVFEGLNPVPSDEGGDLLLVQGQYIPLERVGKEAPAPSKPTPEPDPSLQQPRFSRNGFHP
jgi:HK97 family phage portal protein